MMVTIQYGLVMQQNRGLWKFTLDDKQFSSYEFFGISTIFLDIDHNGKIWFTDTPNSKIGNFDPNTEEFEMIEIPPLVDEITILNPDSTQS